MVLGLWVQLLLMCMRLRLMLQWLMHLRLLLVMGLLMNLLLGLQLLDLLLQGLLRMALGLCPWLGLRLSLRRGVRTEFLRRCVELVFLIPMYLVAALSLGMLRMLHKLLGLAIDVLSRIIELLSLARLPLDVHIAMVRFLELLRLCRRGGVLLIRVVVGSERVRKIAVPNS